MEFSKKLVELRKKSGLTQSEVAELMTHKGVSTKYSSISRWESGQFKPSIEQFFVLCKIYSVEDIKQTFMGESSLSCDLLSGLNRAGQQHAKELINAIYNNPVFTETEPEKCKDERYIKLYNLAASAGTGTYLDSDDYEEILVDNTVPYNADFAVKVGGDSMMPRFIPGQTIFVKIQELLNVGDFGIFALDGESLFKKWGGNKLISLNPKYEPIKLKKYNDLRIFGKVIG